MSRQGWQEFLAAEGAEDWVVWHRGATAVLRVRSLRDATGLADLARAASAVARAQGAVPDRTAVHQVQLAIAAKRDTHDVGFPMADDNAVDPLGPGSTVWMQERDEQKALHHAMDVNVSVARDQVETRLAAALAVGGRVVDDAYAPSHWPLSDGAGNHMGSCTWPDGSRERPSWCPRTC